jgi:hypothetical protein
MPQPSRAVVTNEFKSVKVKYDDTERLQKHHSELQRSQGRDMQVLCREQKGDSSKGIPKLW